MMPSAGSVSATPVPLDSDNQDCPISTNDSNPFRTITHKGDMTWYSQGLGACGDTYNNSSMTAAVSKMMYDCWPGYTDTGNPNTNPICGPMISDSCGSIIPCHEPLTATVYHGENSIQVKIVDRCTHCQVNDIDLTPAAFSALAGNIGIGRTNVTWKFNKIGAP
ncbi:DPBB-1 domain-containing protein [Mycena venus]|uniref:DPBB-1 domain-containing protein n=1 Tax=Mycena venus TaxID=2733690 RepID=A0A8H6Z6P7_9AGAR|nr:DPBB-1 domain-containing protein [Mycena venus]